MVGEREIPAMLWEKVSYNKINTNCCVPMYIDASFGAAFINELKSFVKVLQNIAWLVI